jgi:CheY-like chemotaxis protein
MSSDAELSGLRGNDAQDSLLAKYRSTRFERRRGPPISCLVHRTLAGSQPPARQPVGGHTPAAGAVEDVIKLIDGRSPRSVALQAWLWGAFRTPDVQCAVPTVRTEYETLWCIPFSVLLVDDDVAFRRLARLLLATHGLSDVTEAGSVAEALVIAERLEPTSALVDVELPDGNGFDLSAQLVAKPWRPRVVLTSVQFSDSFPNRARIVGAEAFISKAELAKAPLKTLLSGG